MAGRFLKGLLWSIFDFPLNYIEIYWSLQFNSNQVIKLKLYRVYGKFNFMDILHSVGFTYKLNNLYEA